MDLAPRAVARVAATFVLALFALLLAAVPASAHAAFVASQPEPGSDLAAAPGVVTLRFSEPLIDDLSSVTVTDPTGQAFTGGPAGEREMRVDVNSTAQGPYTVAWKTVSPIDGHTLQAQFTFGVGTDVGGQAAASNAPSATDLLIAAARAVEYLGLLATLGFLTLGALARAVELTWEPRGLHRWVVVATVGGVVTVASEVLLAASGSLATAAGAFLLAPSGLPRVARLVTEVAAAGIALRAARRSGDGTVPPGRVRVSAALLTLAALTALAAAGHAAAAGFYGVLTDAGHLWAAGMWAGTIIAMAVHRPPGGWRSDLGKQMVGEFTPIALATFAATVVLGSLRGVQELAGFGDLWSTAYGQVLWFKVTLVLAMVPLSALAWRRRRAHPRGEGLLAVGAILAAAVLAAFPVPPARVGDEATEAVGRETAGLPQAGDLTLARTAGTTVVGLSIRPGEPGINDVYVHLVPVGGAEDAGRLDVSVAVDGEQPADMDRCGAACRVATVPLDSDDTLNFDVDGDGGGTASFALPQLPTPDGSKLADELTDRMQQITSLRYDEVFGPIDPPITSTWEIVAPDRLHGVIHDADEYRETIRIGDRRWNRESPDGTWEGGEPGGPVVDPTRFIWDYDDKVAARIVGRDRVDGVETRVVSFYVEVGGLSIWYRLWADDQARVRKAQMRAQGHFMDHRYYDFDAPIRIQPPT